MQVGGRSRVSAETAFGATMGAELELLSVVVGDNAMLVHPRLSQDKFVSACVGNVQANALRVFVVAEGQFDGVRDFTTVEHSSSKSSRVNDVRQGVLYQLQFAREISVDVSNTGSTGVNQGLQAVLDGALLNRAGYRDRVLPRGLRVFHP